MICCNELMRLSRTREDADGQILYIYHCDTCQHERACSLIGKIAVSKTAVSGSNPAAPADVLEVACEAWYNNRKNQGQYLWKKMVSLEDPRIPKWRSDMEAALKAIGVLNEVD